MSWIEDIIGWAVDTGSSAASTVVDFAKNNPLATAGIVHGLTSGGDFGQRAGEALKWGGLGYAADTALGSNQWFSGQGSAYGTGTPGLQAPSTASGPSSGSAWNNSTVGTGAVQTAPGVTVSTPTVGGGDFGGMHSEVTQAAGSEAGNVTHGSYIPAPSAGAGLSTGASSAGLSNATSSGSSGPLSGTAWDNSGGTATAGRVMDKVNGGLQTIRNVSKQYGDVVGLGIKGYSALQGIEQGKKAQEYMEQQARQRQEAMDQNKAIVDKQNALTEQRANEYLAMDPQYYAAKAYSDVMGRQAQAANQLESTELSKGYSAATAAANKRRAMLGASTGASTAAESARAQREGTRMAGLAGIRYSTQATPTFDSGYYNAVANSGRAETEGAVKFLDDLTGLQTNKAKDQVQQDKVPQ